MAEVSAAAVRWRKIAASSWRHPSDPQIYGDFHVEATRLLEFVEQARRRSGVHVTITHLVGRAIAVGFAEHPDLNVRLYRGRFVPRESVDVFFVVSASGGRELSGVKVRDADRKSVVEVAAELERRAARLRGGADVEFDRTKAIMAATPTWLLRRVLGLASWLTADVNVDLGRLGLPREAFGGAIVSSVAMFGVEHAYGPLSHWYRVPVLALVSEVEQRAVVVDGVVVARPMLTITATMDHRYLDGAHAGRLAHSARRYLEDPFQFEPLPQQAEVAAAQEG